MSRHAPKPKKYASPRQVARKEKILESARTILEAQGYDGLTMRGLAQEAGVAPATLYNLYKSKNDLIVASVDALLSELRQRVEAQGAQPGVESLLVLTEENARQIQRQPAYAEALCRALFQASPGDLLIDVIFNRHAEFVRVHLEHARENGELNPDVEVATYARLLNGQGWGVMLHWLLGSIPLAELVRERLRSEYLFLLPMVTREWAAVLRERLAALDQPDSLASV